MTLNDTHVANFINYPVKLSIWTGFYMAILFWALHSEETKKRIRANNDTMRRKPAIRRRNLLTFPKQDKDFEKYQNLKKEKELNSTNKPLHLGFSTFLKEKQFFRLLMIKIQHFFFTMFTSLRFFNYWLKQLFSAAKTIPNVVHLIIKVSLVFEWFNFEWKVDCG